MSEAPERIWATVISVNGGEPYYDLGGNWEPDYASADPDMFPTEYVRADRLAAVEAERDALREAVRAAGALLRQVPRQINDSFGAGMEEREGGSWRRQGKLLDQTGAFEAETREWLAKHGGKDV